MGGKIITIGLVCFLLGAGAAMFFGPWLVPPPDDELPASPYLEKRALAEIPPQVVTSIGRMKRSGKPSCANLWTASPSSPG